MTKLNREVAEKFKLVLMENGYRGLQLSLLMAQAAHETGGFNHKRALANNNYAGVKYRRSLSKVASSSEDYFAPASEDNGKRIPYARFKDIRDFVKEWIPYTHLNQMVHDNKLGAPLAATDLSDFAHRLKLNHYYQAPESTYLKGLNNWTAVLRQSGLLAASVQQLEAAKAFSALAKGGKLELPESTSVHAAQDKVAKSTTPANALRLPMIFSSASRHDPEKKAFTKAYQENANVIIKNKAAGLNRATRYQPLAQPEKELESIVSANEWSRHYSSQRNAFPYLPGSVASIERTAERDRNNFQQTENSFPFRLPMHQTSVDKYKIDYTIPFLKMHASAMKPKQESRGLLTASSSGGLPAYVSNILDNNTTSYRNWDRRNTVQLPGFTSPDRTSTDTFFQTRDNRDQSDNRSNNSNQVRQASQVVNINLNQPLIGHFTIAAPNTTEGINDLKQKVEEVLLEVIDNANSIQ